MKVTRAFLAIQRSATLALMDVWSSLQNCVCAAPSLPLAERRVAAKAWRRLGEEYLLVVLELRGGKVLLHRVTRQGTSLRR